jgi:hemoglobin-like flavoprotein
MFAGVDMAEQQKKLIASLVLVVAKLRDGELMAGALRRLGAKYAQWDVRPEHYDAVGATLLATFAEHLGPEWPPTVHQAWVEAYGAITALLVAPREAS